MTDDRTLERAAREWLEEGPTRAPDRPVDAALARIQTTAQERDRWIPWRPRTMFDRLAAAAAVAVLAIGALSVGASLLLRPTHPASGACPREFNEAEAVDTFAPGLTESQRAWGGGGGAVARRPGPIAAFAWNAASAPASVITIDPNTGARCRLLRFVDDKQIRANISQLDWSPSGDALAIGIENPLDPDAEAGAGGESGQVLIWTPTRLLRVWSGPGQTPGLEWAPDGRSIAVWMPGWASSASAVQIIPADGSGTREIDVRPYRLRWSPDGSRWIIDRIVDQRRTEVVVVDLADGRSTQIDLGLDLSVQEWLDDERALLVETQAGIGRTRYLDVPLAAPDTFTVANPSADAVDDDGFIVLSPDRGRAAYPDAGGDLKITELTGEPGSSPVHVKVGVDFWPGAAWAPDGSQLVFATPVGSSQSNATYAMWIVNADGTDLRQVTVGNLWTMDDPWQPAPIR